MKIIFFGTSIFAIPSLIGLSKAGHEIILVVTQPDRKKGRHLHLTPPPIKEIASSLDIPVYQPQDASAAESLKVIGEPGADLFVVVSFGQILSEEVLRLPKKFAINLHASVLPKYRGAGPINWAIMNGDKKTGVTVFRLEKKMDAGDIILKEEIAIEDKDNSVTLAEKLSHKGAAVLVEAVGLIDKNKAVFEKQDEALATFAPKLKKSDGLIDWSLPADMLHNRVRGLLPWPAAFTYFKGKLIRVLETSVCACEDAGAEYGRVIRAEKDSGIIVKAKKSCLAIKRLQLEASRPMDAEEFLRGHKLRAGDIFKARAD